MTDTEHPDPLVGGLLLHVDPGAGADVGLIGMLAGAATPLDEAASWCRQGRIYTLRSVLDPEPPAAAALVLSAPFTWVAELRSLVVGPEHRRAGLAHRLLLGIADDLRGRGLQLLVTAVPSARDDWLGPLRRAGFRAAGAARPGEPPEHTTDVRVGDALWLTLLL